MKESFVLVATNKSSDFETLIFDESLSVVDLSRSVSFVSKTVGPHELPLELFI